MHSWPWRGHNLQVKRLEGVDTSTALAVYLLLKEEGDEERSLYTQTNCVRELEKITAAVPFISTKTPAY